MRRTVRVVIWILVIAAGAGARAAHPGISGNYLEARTSDVFTGPCVANSEVNLQGKQAIVAWSVGRGRWQDVQLDGLSVVAVLRASATLGDPYASPQPIRSMLLVDDKASPAQRVALVSLARELAGDLLDETVAIEAVSLTARFDGAGGTASLIAGDLAEVRTRPLCHHDRHCGNEEVYYPPLTRVDDAVPAFAETHAYRGSGLGGTWSSPGKRSAFVGTFAR